MPRLCLLLIDPHASFREAARSYLLRCRFFRSVEAEASYHEGMFLAKDHFPDVLLIDSKVFFDNSCLIKELEKIKQANPALKVLVLFLFREEDINRCQELFPLVSGIILKESFAEDLLEYISAGNKNPAGKQKSACKGG